MKKIHVYIGKAGIEAATWAFLRETSVKNKRKMSHDSTRTCPFGPLQTHGHSAMLVPAFRLGAENAELCVPMGCGIRHHSLNVVSATLWLWHLSICVLFLPWDHGVNRDHGVSSFAGRAKFGISGEKIRQIKQSHTHNLDWERRVAYRDQGSWNDLMVHTSIWVDCPFCLGEKQDKQNAVLVELTCLVERRQKRKLCK